MLTYTFTPAQRFEPRTVSIGSGMMVVTYPHPQFAMLDQYVDPVSPSDAAHPWFSEWSFERREFTLGLMTPLVGRAEGFRVIILPLWIVPAALALPLALLLWLDRRRPGPGCCPHCGYDLTGNQSGICSECGEPAPRDSRKIVQCPADPPS